MNGNRKLQAFYVTQGGIAAITVGAFLTGVQLTGDNIIAIGTLMVANGGAFYGANYGEHYSKAKAAKAAAAPEGPAQ